MRKVWSWYLNHSFMSKITVGFVTGVIVALLLGAQGQIFAPLGQIFMNLLQMIVIPLLFLSLVVAVNHSNPHELGRIGMKIFPYYFISIALSVIMGIIIAKLINPGAGLTLPTEAQITLPDRPDALTILINIIPANLIKAFVEGNVLSIVFVALIGGLAVLYMRYSENEPQREMGNRLMDLADALNELTLRILNGVLQYAPFGIFGITASTIGTQGWETIVALGKFLITAYIGVLFLFILLYPLILRFFKVPVLKFYRDIKEAMMTSFATCSSLGTLPITIKAAEKAGISPQVANLTLPIGATVNMNGTALRLGVAIVFASEIMGLDLALSEIITTIVIGTLISVGTAGVPGAGLIAMSIVFTHAGLPIEIVALTAGVNVLLDMIFTLANVTGDLVGAKIVDQSEKRYEARQQLIVSESNTL